MNTDRLNAILMSLRLELDLAYAEGSDRWPGRITAQIELAKLEVIGMLLIDISNQLVRISEKIEGE